MEPIDNRQVVDARSLPPLDAELCEELVLRTNPELEVIEEEEDKPYVIVPQSAEAVRLTGRLRRVLETFSEPRPAAVALAAAESPLYLNRLLGARILLRHEVRCLITGCGRSGTAYVSRLLGELGADVPHETMGLDGIASWLLAVDAGSAPWGPVRRHFRYRAILHQVRHPLAAIASAQTFQPESWQYIFRYIPGNAQDPLLLRCARYWHFWNLQAEQIAAWTYRVEDLPAVLERLCEAAGVPVDRSCLEAVPATANSRSEQYRAVSWTDLSELDPNLTRLIEAQAVRYGYTL